MDEFQIKYFADRLKKIAKSDYGGVGKLAEAIGLSNLSNYTKYKNTQEPKASMLFRFAQIGIDVNYLLTGTKMSDQYLLLKFEEIKKEFEERFMKLESSNYRLLEKLDELKIENNTLKEENARLTEENNILRVHYGKVADIEQKYKIRKSQ